MMKIRPFYVARGCRKLLCWVLYVRAETIQIIVRCSWLHVDSYRLYFLTSYFVNKWLITRSNISHGRLLIVGMYAPGCPDNQSNIDIVYFKDAKVNFELICRVVKYGNVLY